MKNETNTFVIYNKNTGKRYGTESYGGYKEWNTEKAAKSALTRLKKKHLKAFEDDLAFTYKHITQRYANGEIDENTYGPNKYATQKGRADNLTLPQIAKLVSDKFLPISRSRAALIARTETHNAASFANHAYHATVEKDLGVKMLKKWVATNDGRTRPAHSAANGQIVDMAEDFIVGGATMGFAGDSKGGAANVVNCRCVIVYADERDMT